MKQGRGNNLDKACRDETGCEMSTVALQCQMWKGYWKLSQEDEGGKTVEGSHSENGLYSHKCFSTICGNVI